MDHVCPFCALHCDDLPPDGGIGTCPTRARALSAETAASVPRVRGREVCLDAALGAAATLLQEARSPLLLASAADVASARALVQLAERLRARLAPWPGTVASVLRPLALRGVTFLATLAEVRSRADLVVLFGTDGSTIPRLFERVLRPSASPFPERLARRRVVCVGEHAPEWDGVEHLPCPTAALHRLAAVLAARLRGERSTRPVDLPGEALDALQHALAAADYAVLAFAPGELPAEGAEVVGDALAGIVRTLNGRARAALLPLSAAPITALDRVALWQAGVPTPLSFADGAPEHEPRLSAPERLLEAGRVDAVLWLAPLLPAPPPPSGVPLVALHHPALAVEAEVSLPVATPGRAADGTFFRLDAIVALRAPAVAPAALPDPASVLRGLLERVPEPAAAGGT